MQGPDCADSHRQPNCILLHQQRGRYEIRLSLCRPLETSVLVSPQRNSAEGSTHTGSLECNSGQAVSTQPSDSVGMVPLSTSQLAFNLLCSKWARPQIDLFATRFNHKLPKFVSLVPDPAAWAVDALSLPWENLDIYAFPPVSLLTRVISKVMDQGCRRMILIAPGWPNMP